MVGSCTSTLPLLPGFAVVHLASDCKTTELGNVARPLRPGQYSDVRRARAGRSPLSGRRWISRSFRQVEEIIVDSAGEGGNLVWRRCGGCGQLTLVPASASVCWQCGTPVGRATPVDPSLFRMNPPMPMNARIPTQEPVRQMPAEEMTPLTTEQIATANQLLASVFPDEIP